MRNFVYSGDQVDCPPPYAVAGGSGALIGPGLFGVAANDTAIGVRGVFRTVGVYDLAKAAGAVSPGAKLYWDNTARVITTTAGSNPHVGAAMQAAASADPTVRIRLNGVTI